MKTRKTRRTLARDREVEAALGIVVTGDDTEDPLNRDLALQDRDGVARDLVLPIEAERGVPRAPEAGQEVDLGRRDGRGDRGDHVLGADLVPATGTGTKVVGGGRGAGHVTAVGRGPVRDHTRGGGATVLVRGHVTVIAERTKQP